MVEEAETARTTSGTAASARRTSESATLVCAVATAVALGVACGFWINSLLASSTAARRPAVTPAPPEARAETTTPSSVETGAVEPSAEPAAATVKGQELKQALPAATLGAREATTQTKPRARLVASFVSREGAKPEGEEQARPSSPCALYASAASLTMRSGGAAFLVVGGPGEEGPVTISTQSWADIAVVREGRTANGWERYAVKSVSNRPGLYTVTFSTPCGSQTIPVTVK